MIKKIIPYLAIAVVVFMLGRTSKKTILPEPTYKKQYDSLQIVYDKLEEQIAELYLERIEYQHQIDSIANQITSTNQKINKIKSDEKKQSAAAYDYDVFSLDSFLSERYIYPPQPRY
jgi:peptidoglycan hydrolase CwlO-like protein